MSESILSTMEEVKPLPAKKPTYCEDCKHILIIGDKAYCRAHPEADTSFIQRSKNFERCGHINTKGECKDFQQKPLIGMAAYCVIILVCFLFMCIYLIVRQMP